MAEVLRLKARGLSRYSDPLSKREEGSLNQADNIVIDQDGLYSPRRGFSRLGGTLTQQAKNIISYQSYLLVYAKDSTEAFNVLYKYDDTTFTEYAGFTSTDPYVISAESNGNIYLTSNSGVYKLDSITGTIIESGIPEALHFSAAVASEGVGSALAADSSVGYKALWGRKDANDNLVLGSPSNTVIHSNTTAVAGTDDVTLTIIVPAEIQATPLLEWFCQLYRTGPATPATNLSVGDELNLVYEALYPTTGGGATISILDQTPDSLRASGKGLYTNATREGSTQKNYQPPQCKDIAVYNNYMFYADVSYKQTLNIQLLATGATAAYGLRDGDTITIKKAGSTDEVYTAKTTPSSAKHFQVYYAASPIGYSSSPAVDIRKTAEAFIAKVNTESLLCYAYYDSGLSELPGLIRIEERNYSSVVFSVISSRGNSFSPNLAANTPSDSESIPNRLMYSKYQEPEAVPTLNFFDVGSKAYPIKRIVALRDSLFIFKGDGIWRLTGTGSSNFAIDAFDSSTKIIASNSLCVLNNLVFGLFDQGVCQVSESGVSVVSREIEGDIRGWIGSNLATLSSLSFGLPYETDRKYFLWVPVTADDTYPTKGYCYNTVTDSWTVFDRPAWAAIVNPANDRLYLAGGNRVYLSKERKGAVYSDFSDEQTQVKVTGVNVKELTLESLTGISVGDLYYESASKWSYISDLSLSNNTITVATNLDWKTYAQLSNAYTEVRAQYNSVIEWNPIHLNSPGHLKQWYEVLLILANDFNSATLQVKTEQDPGWESISMTGNASSDWGLFPWGEAPWGGAQDVDVGHRTYVPKMKQRSGTLHLKLDVYTMFTDWILSGVEVTYRDAGQRLLRR